MRMAACQTITREDKDSELKPCMSKVKSNKSLVSGACTPLYLLHLSLADNFWSLGLLGTAAAVVVTALMMFAIVGS